MDALDIDEGERLRRLRPMPDGNLPAPHSGVPTNLKGDAELAARVDVMAGVTMTYGVVQPWQELWRSVLAALEQLEAAYRGAAGQQNGDALKRLPTLFCQDCWHLRDWLRHDLNVPRQAATAVVRYAEQQPGLQTARDVANTHKHYGRNPRYREARIGQMASRADQGLVKVTIRIDWRDPGGATGSKDALDMARTAVAEWRAFFNAHALDEAG